MPLATDVGTSMLAHLGATRQPATGQVIERSKAAE